MALIMMDGFDKYGPSNSNSSINIPIAPYTLLRAGEWSVVDTSASIANPLSTTGWALILGANTTSITKNFPANYPRLIGGVRFSSPLGNTYPCAIINFCDGVTSQCSINIGYPSRIVELRNTYSTGTLIATGGPLLLANQIHYIEWDITFGNAAPYQIWLDGVSIISGTGDTTSTTNNYVNSITLGFKVTSADTVTIDDFYLFDNTGATLNAPLLSNPRIETTFPVYDSSVQFAIGASMLYISGFTRTSNSQFVMPANVLHLRRFIPPVSGSLTTLYVIVATNNATTNTRAVVYADAAGVPGALLGSGPTVVGFVSQITSILPLTTPVPLTGGVAYWFGVHTDGVTGPQFYCPDNVSGSVQAVVTYASGPPSTAPTVTGGKSNITLWGTLSGVTNNWYENAMQPAPITPWTSSYVYDAIVGHEDLYGFTPLSVSPTFIHAVALKGYCQKSDTGVRTVTLRMKSSTVDDGGSNTGFAPNVSTFQWVSSLFETDPNTGGPWTGPTLDAATAGYRIDV